MSPEELANLLRNLGLITFDSPALAQGFDVLNTSGFFAFFNAVKTIAVIVIFVLILLIALTILKIVALNRTSKEKVEPLKPVPMYSRWQEIKNHSESLQEGQWKFAIIEADNLVDDVLKKLGYPGETMGERIQFVDKHEIPSVDSLWRAHRLRNRLVHEPTYTLRREEMEEALRNYESALRELGAI